MPIEITIPRLGWSMEEGIFAGWLKADSEPVSIGEPIYALESEKVTMEVESLDNGILHIPTEAPTAGSTVLVGQLVGYLLVNGEPPPGPIATPDPTPASPRARAAARNLGIDIATVQPREGAARIIEADVLKAKPAPMAAPAPRAGIAARMEESFRAPHFYLHADANVEALAALRHQHRPAAYNDFLIKAIAIALVRHPRVNAYWHNGAVIARTTAHVALAAQIGDTLVTPVITDPAEKSLAQIARDREQALIRKDASATLSNLGSFGVDRFEAILNPPQSIIVAVGKIAKRPVVVDDQVVARLTMPISLSVDHRVVDGVPAAAFLQTLIGVLESPAATYNEWE
jgi:pyruvate dehydrogenase E2 component (dihydrolipoamide acetyltransferase)